MTFGPKADDIIRKARIDHQFGTELTLAQRIMLLLSDGQWHSSRELATNTSHRFGGYLHTLKRNGVAWECEVDPDAPKGKRWFRYRLHSPDRPQTPLF